MEKRISYSPQRQNMNHKTKKQEIKVEDVVMIKGGNKPRGICKIGVISKVYPGQQSERCTIKVKTSKGFLDRPIQWLYPLELHCNITQSNTDDDSKTVMGG